MPTSADLPPIEGSYARLFIKSQLFTHPHPPPKDLNLTGQTGIITGANSGLGLQTAKELLACHISHIILAVRTLSKGEAAAVPLRREYPSANIDVWQMDMLSYESMDKFIGKCSTLERIDFVVLNAAAVQTQFKLVPGTCHEETFQVCYLSTAYLALGFSPVLKAKRPMSTTGQITPGRMVLVTSILGYTTTLPTPSPDGSLISAFDDEKNFIMQRYAQSKLLIMMFVHKLSTLVSASDVVINCVEPGFLKGATALDRNAPAGIRFVAGLFRRAMGRALRGGSWTVVDAAVVKGVESHGCFLHNWEVYPWAKTMYTEEGRNLVEKLWRETLDDSPFEGVKGALEMEEGE